MSSNLIGPTTFTTFPDIDLNLFVNCFSFHCGAERSDASRFALLKCHWGSESPRARHTQLLLLILIFAIQRAVFLDIQHVLQGLSYSGLYNLEFTIEFFA